MLETVGEGAYGIVWKARNRGNFFISQYSAHLIQIFLLSFFSYILLWKYVGSKINKWLKNHLLSRKIEFWNNCHSKAIVLDAKIKVILIIEKIKYSGNVI